MKHLDKRETALEALFLRLGTLYCFCFSFFSLLRKIKGRGKIEGEYLTLKALISVFPWSWKKEKQKHRGLEDVLTRQNHRPDEVDRRGSARREAAQAWGIWIPHTVQSVIGQHTLPIVSDRARGPLREIAPNPGQAGAT